MRIFLMKFFIGLFNIDEKFYVKFFFDKNFDSINCIVDEVLIPLPYHIFLYKVISFVFRKQKCTRMCVSCCLLRVSIKRLYNFFPMSVLISYKKIFKPRNDLRNSDCLKYF